MKYALMEICYTPECDCCGGGWLIKKSADIEELHEIADRRENEMCPDCYASCIYEIWEVEEQ